MTPPTDQNNKKVLHRNTAIRTVVFYMVFALLWIYLSDTVLALFISDPQRMAQVQTIKGGLFVLVTATLLYLYLTHCLKSLRSTEEALAETQHKVQREMEERIEQLNTLFDSMNAIVYVADMETYELLYVNKFTEDYFGQSWEGHKCFKYLQEDTDTPCKFCTNSQLLKDGKPGEPTVWEFCNTKNQRWYECFDKAIYWTDGRLARLEVALDITERKELEQIKDDLLSSMSHEMRTPLTAVSGFAELLLNEQDLAEQHKRHIEIIYREADKLAELVNRFLDVRRLKVNRARVNYEHVPVAELLEKASKSARDCREHHQININCQTDSQIYGNRKELSQVTTQLLENACRYSPEGGEISVLARESGQEIAISVTDQGIGIPKHEIESIFKPFHRLDTGDSRSTGGVGLGLCVAQEIVTLHGGHIEVESTLNEGSTFTIVLPQPSSVDELSLNANQGNEQS